MNPIATSHTKFAHQAAAPRDVEITRGVASQALVHGFQRCDDIDHAGAMRAILRVLATWRGVTFSVVDADAMVRARFGDNLADVALRWLEGLELPAGGAPPRQLLLEMGHRFTGIPKSPTHNLLACQQCLIVNMAQVVALGSWAAGCTRGDVATLVGFLFGILRNPQDRQLAREAAYFARAFLTVGEGNPIATIPRSYP